MRLVEMRTAYKFLVQKPEEENEHVGYLGDGRIIKLILEKLGMFMGFGGGDTIINTRCS